MATKAAPLDDAHIRSIFADAPDDLTAPSDVSSLFRARMRSLWEARTGLIVATLAIGIVLALGLLIAGSSGGAVAVLAVLVIAAIATTWTQSSRAKQDFFRRYCTARGLEYGGSGRVPTSAVPLFRKGDKRTCEQVMHGTIHGVPATLANYTYTVESTDSEGKSSDTDYPYVVLHLTLPPQVAARYVGVYLAPKSLTLGALQDKLAHDRGVTLESIEFHKRYTLRVVDAQDDIALYELFHPAFIEQLTTGPEVTWEQVGADIVFYRKRHEKHAAGLDRFVADCACVLARYREEYQ